MSATVAEAAASPAGVWDCLLPGGAGDEFEVSGVNRPRVTCGFPESRIDIMR